MFYLSKLNLIKFSDGKTSAADGLEINDSETLDEESRMNEAIADFEEKDSIDATGDIYKDKNYFNILLIGIPQD